MLINYINEINVFYKDRLVGKLGQLDNRKVCFTYSKNWLKNGFALNPLTLPLIDKIFIPENFKNFGLFGVFADSLPDQWGSVLIDKFLQSLGHNPSDFSLLSKLTLLGNSSYGALSYRPAQPIEIDGDLSLDEIYQNANLLFESKEIKDINKMFKVAGSSGGSRPKAYLKIGQEDWIVKFPHRNDFKNIARIEYEYMETVRECGINIPEFRLIHTDANNEFYAIKRFDRNNGQKIHTISASSLLEEDAFSYLIDYKNLFQCILYICKNNEEDRRQLYKLMCFNILAKNQDDHGKNFSFIYDEITKNWHLAPAYDLTYSITQFNQQSMTVNGKGSNITENDIVQLGVTAGLNKEECVKVYKKIKSVVEKNLSKFWK